ncbi:hypothetical protein HX867_22660 [Pseudomonas gingeri]|uniref:hypothetical protein n=1 Tax=Pseudomonas gingeri TaxID=117681 RepID=UPI0015A4D6DD|nr:hypothetical protein [Pseudomonas gingeri]NVZ64911.1 hypothetical protein [Pseudomonas gingeri]NVZ78821.1 hypothetical protein [Pseudomonas gingeri]
MASFRQRLLLPLIIAGLGTVALSAKGQPVGTEVDRPGPARHDARSPTPDLLLPGKNSTLIALSFKRTFGRRAPGRVI